MTEKLMETFQNLFGADGDIRTYFAPGRVNLIGEHIMEDTYFHVH